MPLQIPQLDDRSFEQLVEEVTARIPVHTPEWNNFNDSDPGMTLVQLFAFMTENLLYRANRIPEANRLKFLNMLGVNLRPASAGRGLVVIHNERGPVRATTLRTSAELLAGNVPFRTRSDINILPVSAAVFYKKPAQLDAETEQQFSELYETFLESDADDLVFYESTPLEDPEIGKPLPEVDLSDKIDGTIDGTLWVALLARPDGDVDAARRAIAGQTLSVGIYPSNHLTGKVLRPETVEAKPVEDPRLVFEIAAPDPNDVSPLPPPRYERLTIEYAEDVLNTPGIVQVTLPRYDKITIWNFDPTEEGTKDYPPRLEDRDLAARVVTWLRIRLPKEENESANAQKQAIVSWVGINATRVIQTIPVVNERLGVGTGAPNQFFKVANTPVILSSGQATGADASFKLEVQNDNDQWEVWEMTDDLYAARDTEKVFRLDPESGQIIFGSGLRGKRPGFEQEIRVSYEYGGGLAGQVNIGAINKSASVPGGFKIDNPVATWGASPGESLQEGEQSITSFIRHRDRLVTIQDFKDITERTPGVNIGRVEVLPLFNPESFISGNPEQSWPGAATVMVVPDHNIEQLEPPQPDRLFLNAICEWLAPRRLVTTEIFVRGPKYVLLYISVGLVTTPGQVQSIVHRDVQDAIREYLSPLVGGPDKFNDDGTVSPGMGWPLGVEVRSQDIEAQIVRVPGVRYVNEIHMGVLNPAGTSLQPVTTKRLEGIQLPWLAGMSVRNGNADPLDDLIGLTPEDDGLRIHVPVVPRKC